MEKFIEQLNEAERVFKAVDHMAYVTFTLIKDKKLLIKILEETKKVIIHCINSILQYEYLNKKIELHNDARENFKVFLNKSSRRFGITYDELKKIIELFKIVERHKQSPFEFLKDDKIVILSENMTKEIVDIKKTKEFLALAKNILAKTRKKVYRIS